MSDQAGRRATSATSEKAGSVPFYTPRFWHGMRWGPWCRLLARNRMRIHPLRWPMVLVISFCAIVNSILAWIQRAVYGRRIAAARVADPPIWVVGHWRSGTTFLHELLCLDPRFTYPTTYECSAPDHFLVSSWGLPWLMGLLLPRRRPMDDVEMGMGRPQEDELALCVMGAPSFMTRAAFPNEPSPYDETLDLDRTDPAVRDRWREALGRFVRCVELKRPGKRIVLKSPPHTGRIAHLADLFPGSQFIHIVRDPRALFRSTVRLWRTLDPIQGLQIPRHDTLDEFVFASCERMYEGFLRQRTRIDPAALVELTYEDLVRDPIGEVRRIYERLGWTGFEEVRPRIEAFLAERREFRPTRYDFPPELEAELQRRWSTYFDCYDHAASKRVLAQQSCDCRRPRAWH